MCRDTGQANAAMCVGVPVIPALCAGDHQHPISRSETNVKWAANKVHQPKINLRRCLSSHITLWPLHIRQRIVKNGCQRWSHSNCIRTNTFIYSQPTAYVRRSMCCMHACSCTWYISLSSYLCYAAL